MFLRSSLFFRHILGHFFPPKYNLHHICERIRSIRYQKGKLNVIKRQKYHFVTRAHGSCSLPSASRDIFLWKKFLAGVLLFSFVWLRNFYIFQIKLLTDTHWIQWVLCTRISNKSGRTFTPVRANGVITNVIGSTSIWRLAFV